MVFWSRTEKDITPMGGFPHYDCKMKIIGWSRDVVSYPRRGSSPFDSHCWSRLPVWLLRKSNSSSSIHPSSLDMVASRLPRRRKSSMDESRLKSPHLHVKLYLSDFFSTSFKKSNFETVHSDIDCKCSFGYCNRSLCHLIGEVYWLKRLCRHFHSSELWKM